MSTTTLEESQTITPHSWTLFGIPNEELDPIQRKIYSRLAKLGLVKRFTITIEAEPWGPINAHEETFTTGKNQLVLVDFEGNPSGDCRWVHHVVSQCHIHAQETANRLGKTARLWIRTGVWEQYGAAIASFKPERTKRPAWTLFLELLRNAMYNFEQDDETPYNNRDTCGVYRFVRVTPCGFIAPVCCRCAEPAAEFNCEQGSFGFLFAWPLCVRCAASQATLAQHSFSVLPDTDH